MRISIIVYGIPGPQGSKKVVGRDGKGRAILVESSAKVKPWRELVHAAGVKARGGKAPLDCPLSVRMVFTMRKPQGAPKIRRTYPMRTPDLSKLIRSTEDALTTSGLWRDDARVVEYGRAAKVFPNEDPEALEAPGVRIVIELYPQEQGSHSQRWLDLSEKHWRDIVREESAPGGLLSQEQPTCNATA